MFFNKKRQEKKNKNILLFLENKTENFENRVALGMRASHGWIEYTYKGIGMLSRKIASYLIKNLEVKKGDRLAILSESRPEFGAIVFASVMSGMTTVPLDIKLTIHELKSILSDCKPTVIVASNKFLNTAFELQKEVNSIKHIISIDETQEIKDKITSIHNIPNNYDEKYRMRSSKSTALIIYTSGTTGNPKGVEISFENMLTQMDDMSILKSTLFKNKPNASVLSILPMNHLFEMTVGFSVFLSMGLSIYYTKSLKPKDIINIMQEKKINCMIVVPAFLKLLKASVETQIKQQSKFQQNLFDFMFNFAKYIPSLTIRKLLFYKINKFFGGSFLGFISGGAPLDINVGEFFQRIGIRIYQGYGLTETSPVVCVNIDRKWDIGSLGKPLKSYEAKIDDITGELLLKGTSIMKGYYNNPQMTKEVLGEDGWLHTGDIANINKYGHIHITGRIKNMIVLSGGKKVFPEEVESVLEKSPNFLDVCVFGSSKTKGLKEGTEEIIAVIVPKQEYIEQINDDEKMVQLVKNEVKELSNNLASYKRPVNIIVLKESLPKTTTRKIKRREVKELVHSNIC